jgi:hypothetical protein
VKLVAKVQARVGFQSLELVVLKPSGDHHRLASIVGLLLMGSSPLREWVLLFIIRPKE